MLRVREWARRYCDMLDGAEEAPTVNELYEAIELDEDDLVKDTFVQANRYTEESLRDLRDEVNWLHAELHGAELEVARAERTCKDVTSEEHTQAFTCSECGCWVAYDEYWETGIYVDVEWQAVHIHPRYCPNCGAKVVEG